MKQAMSNGRSKPIFNSSDGDFKSANSADTLLL
jgi:hypothetical protein